MPGFDGTGPRGQGAMTGRGRGYCVVALNDIGSRPANRGGFYGRGMRCGFRQAVSKEEELNMLKTQTDLLKNQLENMQARIQNLEEKKGAN
jgi:hypothetical protein